MVVCSAAHGHGDQTYTHTHTHTQVHQNCWICDELSKRQSFIQSQTLVHTGASRSILHNNRQHISVKEKLLAGNFSLLIEVMRAETES